MQDLKDVNSWLQERMTQDISIDTKVFEEIISKVSQRQQLVELYLQQKVFNAEQIQQEQKMNDHLYRWVYTLRDQIQKKLIEMQKSKQGSSSYQQVKSGKSSN